MVSLAVIFENFRLSWKNKDKWSSLFCGLYYKNILTIVSDDRKWSLYYSTAVIYDRHLMYFTLAL